MMVDGDDSPLTAEELLGILKRLPARIPEFRHLTNDEIIALRKASTVDPDWVLHAASTAGASTHLQLAVGSTPEEIREEIEQVSRWSGVETELRSLLQGVSAANLIRRHRIGLKALQIYGIARQLVRHPEHANLRTFVARHQQMNKLGKRKTKQPPEE